MKAKTSGNVFPCQAFNLKF